MPKTASTQIAGIGIDIGKNSFHVVGHDKRGSVPRTGKGGVPPRV
jgi:hypothetical protein